MASLSSEKSRKAKKMRRFYALFSFILLTLIVPYISSFVYEMLANNFDVASIHISYLTSWSMLFHNNTILKLSGIFEAVVLLVVFCILTSSWFINMKTSTMMVTDKISIPVAIGEGQHGTARFMTDKEKDKYFTLVKYNGEMKDKYKALNLGLVLGMTKTKKTEYILCISEDLHSIIIGATRSGKTRRDIYETIWLRSYCNRSMIISDPKGELFLSFKPFLENLGYEVIDYDFREPLKSKRYNYLSCINKAVKENDLPTAIDYTWDLVSVMVGEPKGEPLWTNGEASVIAAAILCVVLEAPEQYRNLTNVYYFLANMCKSDQYGDMPITTYFSKLPDEHPAKGVFAAAELSPDRTRSSFFGSALTTLRLFTNWNIADMTSFDDYDISNIGRKKTAIFIIIPDEKKTLYSLVSIMINQMYTSLVKVANEYGGRLLVETEFILDEFGNFPVIPSFGSMLSVGAGRGIRFSLVVQDFQQVESKYEKDFDNIKGNCLVWVYLKSPTIKTLEEISKKTGTYTVQVNSVNSSISSNQHKSISYSGNANMSSRALLLPDEVGKFENPYSLVLYSGKHPAVFYSPDLSAYLANSELGLGDQKFNQALFLQRNNNRLSRSRAVLNLWKIWNSFIDSSNDDNDEDDEDDNMSDTNSMMNTTYI